MTQRPRPSFNFHAEGHAFSAEIRRPVPQHIPALAATSLPTIGGHGHHRIENYSIPRIISFKAAHTHVSGTFADEKIATTHATTSIEGYNLLDFVTADRITARLTSEHKISDPEGHIIALGSVFDNLKIGGYLFTIKLRHKLLLDNKTHRARERDCIRQEKRQNIATKGGLALCSLVEEIITDFPGLTPADKKKHIIQIPHFGTIAFAEVLSEDGTKTLTMLRLELGCPDELTGTTAQARTNGQIPPPVPDGH